MAYVKISGRNTLGFKHHLFRATLLGLLAFVVLGIAGDLIGGAELGNMLQVIGFIAAPVVYNIIGVRRERFAPMLFVRRDPLLPRNDLECWCASTFAIWARFFDGMEGWPLICGAHKSKKFQKSMRTTLEGDWGVRNREECLETVHSLTRRHLEQRAEPGAGWDLCRAVQLLGMLYAVDWVNRDELDEEFSRAGQAIQQRFGSWEDLCESYLEGYAAWRTKIDGQGAEWSISQRRLIYQTLKDNKYGPYAIAWDTDLSWNSDVSVGGGRSETKRLLARYQPD